MRKVKSLSTFANSSAYCIRSRCHINELSEIKVQDFVDSKLNREEISSQLKIPFLVLLWLLTPGLGQGTNEASGIVAFLQLGHESLDKLFHCNM